jgi:hypothetical protein
MQLLNHKKNCDYDEHSHKASIFDPGSTNKAYYYDRDDNNEFPQIPIIIEGMIIFTVISEKPVILFQWNQGHDQSDIAITAFIKYLAPEAIVIMDHINDFQPIAL